MARPRRRLSKASKAYLYVGSTDRLLPGGYTYGNREWVPPILTAYINEILSNEEAIGVFLFVGSATCFPFLESSGARSCQPCLKPTGSLRYAEKHTQYNADEAVRGGVSTKRFTRDVSQPKPRQT